VDEGLLVVREKGVGSREIVGDDRAGLWDFYDGGE
jgi:hypothetical protein